jgi:hypothetical protein
MAAISETTATDVTVRTTERGVAYVIPEDRRQPKVTVRFHKDGTIRVEIAGETYRLDRYAHGSGEAWTHVDLVPVAAS